MRFGIQMGYGLQQATIDLVRKWQGGVIIISPRAFKVRPNVSAEELIARYCTRIGKLADEVYIDPMLYTSRRLLRQIAAAEYATSVVRKGRDGYPEAVRSVLHLNDACGTTASILPAWTIDAPDNDWVRFQRNASQIAESMGGTPAYATVALTADFLKSDGCIDWIATEAEGWSVQGVFLALEHPNGDYLTDEPLWLLNAMCLAATLKRMGKRVMLGYGSHQLLVAVLAKCNYLCCGNFLNVRRFSTKDFEAQTDDGQSRRATWYYVPQALSEYRLPTLDLAHAVGVLPQLRSPYASDYDSMLFSGAIPSSTAYNEGHSFRHYLHSLHEQCSQLSAGSYDEVRANCQALVWTAEILTGELRDMGVHDAQRNFARASQACGQAMSAFDTKMGFVMRQVWNRI